MSEPTRCEELAEFSYVWDGKARSFCCKGHAALIDAVAQAMGKPLHFHSLDSENRSQCSSSIDPPHPKRGGREGSDEQRHVRTMRCGEHMAVKVIEGKNYKCGTKKVSVVVPAHLSGTGDERWSVKPVDSCVADIVTALVQEGVFTDACCCGHGVVDPETGKKIKGSIILADGRVLEIEFPDDWPNHSGETNER